MRSRLAWSGSMFPIPVPLLFYSFGGWKDSIFGDHDIYGPDGSGSTRRRRRSSAGGRTRSTEVSTSAFLFPNRSGKIDLPRVATRRRTAPMTTRAMPAIAAPLSR